MLHVDGIAIDDS